MPTKELYDLCWAAFGDSNSRARLAKIKQLLESDEGTLLREAANYFDANNGTPLHWLTGAHPPGDLIKKLIQLAPGSVKVENHDGDLPLHGACHHKASPEVVRLLLEAYPEAAEIKDNFGWMPLHIACLFKASPDVIQLLLEANPRAAEVQNNYGQLPLYIACDNLASADIVRMLLVANPQAANSPNNHGSLPLHYACQNKAALAVIKMLLEVNPKAAEIQTNYGSLPLHLACDHQDHQVVRMLVNLYPNATKIRDKNGFLPLHYACRNRASLEVMDLLVVAYPESVEERSLQGLKKPSDYLKEYSDYFYGEKYKFLLHEAVISGFSFHLIKLLLQAFPESCVTQDASGMTPLHYACSKSAEFISINVVMLLFDTNPVCCAIINNNGKTAFELLSERASREDQNGMLLLHHIAASSKIFTVRSLFFLLKVYPESLTVADSNRMLPFHHACFNKSSSLDILMSFIQLQPESILWNI
jgi:ankyrin repeat protein